MIFSKIFFEKLDSPPLYSGHYKIDEATGMNTRHNITLEKKGVYITTISNLDNLDISTKFVASFLKCKRHPKHLKGEELAELHSSFENSLGEFFMSMESVDNSEEVVEKRQRGRFLD